MIADISQKDELELIEIENERFYKINNVDDLPPFFMIKKLSITCQKVHNKKLPS